MLFDIGWPELLLIGTVALVVIGPKDLPRALRVAGFWVRKARTLSREFQSSIDQMIREAELDEMRQELKKATEFDIEKEFQNTIDPKGTLAESIKPPDLPDFFDDTPAAPVHTNDTAPPATGAAEEAGHAAAEPMLIPDNSEEQLPLPFNEPAKSEAVPVAAAEPTSASAHEAGTAHEPAPPKP
jgi:sec-independent protein translocase protein TatB